MPASARSGGAGLGAPHPEPFHVRLIVRGATSSTSTVQLDRAQPLAGQLIRAAKAAGVVTSRPDLRLRWRATGNDGGEAKLAFSDATLPQAVLDHRGVVWCIDDTPVPLLGTLAAVARGLDPRHLRVPAPPGLRAIAAIAAITAVLWPLRDPLASGVVPAAGHARWGAHWEAIKGDPEFIQDMTRPLLYVAGCNNNNQLGRGSVSTCLASAWPCPATQLLLKLGTYDAETELTGLDYGGSEGHIPEAIELGNERRGTLDTPADALAVTRCSTTRSALTAYFCGAAVATNMDRALGAAAKWGSFGLPSFVATLRAGHSAGKLATAAAGLGVHRAAVYRLGIGAETAAGTPPAFLLPFSSCVGVGKQCSPLRNRVWAPCGWAGGFAWPPR